MEMQLHVARAIAQISEQKHAQAMEQQRQELAAAHQRREDALRSLQHMAGLLSAAARQEEAARAQAAAAGAMAANARAQRDMLAARLAEAERQLASVAAAAADAQPTVGTPVSNPPRQAQGTPPPQQQQREEEDGHVMESQGLDACPSQQQQAACPGVHPHRSAEEEARATLQCAGLPAPHVAALVQPSSTSAVAPDRHDTTAPSHPPSQPPSRSHAPNQTTAFLQQLSSTLPPPPPLAKLPFPLPRARLDECADGSCRQCGRTHSGLPCKEAYPWTASAWFADSAWRSYMKRHPDTPAARFGEPFRLVDQCQQVQLLGRRRGQLLALEWEEDDEGQQQQQQEEEDDHWQPDDDGDDAQHGHSTRAASHAGGRREEDEEERRGRGVEGRQRPRSSSAAARAAGAAAMQQPSRRRAPSPSNSNSPGRGGRDTVTPSGELPFPLPPATISEDAHGACTHCLKRSHPGRPCLARFPWAASTRLLKHFWWTHKMMFPREPTAEHEPFQVAVGTGSDVTRVVLGFGPGGSTVLTVPRAGGSEPLPSAESGGGGGGGRDGKEERGRRKERRGRSRSREGKGERSRSRARSSNRGRKGKEERSRRKERRSRSRSRSAGEGQRRRVER